MADLDMEHRNNLNKLCRICGKVLPKHSNQIVTLDLKIKLQEAFPTDFSSDKLDIHPTHVCNNCYSKLNNFENRGSMHCMFPVSWEPHSHNCGVCKTNKGGRPSKSKGRKGRPKTTPEESIVSEKWSSELLTSVFFNSPSILTNVSLSKLNINTAENPQLQHIICSFCKDFLKRPVLLTCDHAYCSICLLSHLQEKKMPKCIVCENIILPSKNSVRPGTVLARLMESVCIVLKCGCSTQLAHCENHVCTISTSQILNLTPTKPIPKDVMDCVGHVVGIKMHLSDLPNKTIQLPSGGPVVSRLFLNMFGEEETRGIKGKGEYVQQFHGFKVWNDPILKFARSKN